MEAKELMYQKMKNKSFGESMSNETKMNVLEWVLEHHSNNSKSVEELIEKYEKTIALNEQVMNDTSNLVKKQAARIEKLYAEIFIQDLRTLTTEWVSVEDGLPKESDKTRGISDRVIAYTHIGTQQIIVYDYELNCWSTNHVTITHWMPLPSPPTTDV